MNNLPTHSAIELSSCTDECPICLDSLESVDQDVGVLECDHRFHMQCLYAWFSQAQSNFKCPCCSTQRDIIKIVSPPAPTVEITHDPVLRSDSTRPRRPRRRRRLFRKLCCSKKNIIHSEPEESI